LDNGRASLEQRKQRGSSLQQVSMCNTRRPAVEGVARAGRAAVEPAHQALFLLNLRSGL
jgi:hypothetical protein